MESDFGTQISLTITITNPCYVETSPCLDHTGAQFEPWSICAAVDFSIRCRVVAQFGLKVCTLGVSMTPVLYRSYMIEQILSDLTRKKCSCNYESCGILRDLFDGISNTQYLYL